MTTVLALDAATDACSAALMKDGRVAGRRFDVIGRGHAEQLMPMVEGAMADAGAAYGDVDLIAVTVGPGAFTGIRIGLAAARALALALGRPCLGVTTFEAIAWAALRAASATPVLAVVESKRTDLFIQPFAADLTSRADPIAVAPERLSETIKAFEFGNSVVLAGDGAERAKTALIGADVSVTVIDAARHPDAAHVAALAAERWRASGCPSEIASPRPLYLRVPDTTAPKKP